MSKPKLTFIAFGRNDEAGEPKRVRLFVESLLCQTASDICLWFWDASQSDKQFKLPDDNRIIIHQEPVPMGTLWNPTYYRNVGALTAETEYIAHVNTDCVYGIDVAQQIITNLRKAKKLIQCKRKPTSKNQFDKINSLKDAYKIAKEINKHESQAVCGDLQALHRQKFLDLKGYNGLIKDGVAIMGDYVDLSKNEDTYLRKKFDNKNSVWIQDKTFVLHLWHTKRENAEHRAKMWRAKHKKGRKASRSTSKKPRNRPRRRR